MVKIHTQYLGQLRVEATHQPSGTTLITDAPVDNQGLGASFSPTDLVGTALASCMLTTMAIVAERHQIELKGTKIDVEKTMSALPFRRIAELRVLLQSPFSPNPEQQKLLENAAMACPVKKALSNEVQVAVEFKWQRAL